MECAEALLRLDDLVLGRLDDDTHARIERHLASCLRCREEYEHARWLATALRDHRDHLRDSHVSAQILYEYAAGDFAGDARCGWIEAHVSQCDDCSADLLAIEQALKVDVTASPGTRRAHLWESLLRSLWRRWVLIPAAVVLLVAAVFVWQRGRAPVRLTHPAELGPGINLVDLPLTLTTRFAVADSVTAVSTGAGTVLLRVDLQHVDALADGYAARVVGPQGGNLFEVSLQRAVVEAGEFYLVVDPARLAAGTHRVEVLALDAGAAEVVGHAAFASEEGGTPR